MEYRTGMGFHYHLLAFISRIFSFIVDLSIFPRCSPENIYGYINHFFKMPTVF